MSTKTLMSWSSGKDSAWALHVLRQQPDVEVVGLLTTINQLYQRISIHAVRLELLQAQARMLGLPLHVVNLPSPCSNVEYETAMQQFIDGARQSEIECIGFGDLFLQDVRDYREARLAGTGITPLFPLWGIPTDQLAAEMLANDIRAVVTCVDPRQLPPSFAGREFSAGLLSDLPQGVDPCGERGEFHTFAYAGPMFRQPVDIQVGEVVEREGFVYADILSAPDSSIEPSAPQPR